MCVKQLHLRHQYTHVVIICTRRLIILHFTMRDLVSALNVLWSSVESHAAELTPLRRLKKVKCANCEDAMSQRTRRPFCRSRVILEQAEKNRNCCRKLSAKKKVGVGYNAREVVASNEKKCRFWWTSDDCHSHLVLFGLTSPGSRHRWVPYRTRNEFPDSDGTANCTGHFGIMSLAGFARSWGRMFNDAQRNWNWNWRNEISRSTADPTFYVDNKRDTNRGAQRKWMKR